MASGVTRVKLSESYPEEERVVGEALKEAIDLAERQGRLLTVADVCKRLQMGRSKVWEWIASGQLESLKLGGARRVTEEQLASFIARQVSAGKVPA